MRRLIYKKLFIAAIIYGFVLFLPFYYFKNNDPLNTEKVPFDSNLKDEIIKEAPDYVFIGNSMVETRINEKLLEDLTDSKIRLFKNHGSASSQWYLFFKNIISDLDNKPNVFFFFRENEFTEPNFRASGTYTKYIESLSTDNETVYNNIIGASSKDPCDNFLTNIHKDSFNTIINETIDLSAMNLIGIRTDTTFKEGIEYYFRLEMFRPTEQGDLQEVEDHKYDFQANIENSFLEEIIEISKKNNIKIILIRVKSRPNYKGEVVISEKIKKYNEDMDQYLFKNQIMIHDFTYDKEIKADWYRDGDHILKTNEYTKHFYEVMKEEFE